ncbi:kinase-like domain-containing protein [Rhizophagus clarus]|uniref:Kinase-like domain-containing protein n=1 Tax=Rhizophagus clarus TaxID=94130 RepID=A0A8H3LBU7_9GLOM|nr:kinase-like domain-containing protein [Rhizophagus clarus]
MWEFTSGIPPFNHRAHDLQLSISICKGERPEIIESTPQCYVDLMKKCWSEDPLERPSAEKISNIIADWIFYPETSDDETSDGEINDNEFSYVDDKSSRKLNETEESECLDCVVNNIKLSDIKTDKN